MMRLRFSAPLNLRVRGGGGGGSETRMTASVVVVIVAAFASHLSFHRF